MRAFLQRSEVRLSTIHRVAQALLGGSALILLMPLFLRDAFPKMMTILISLYDSHQSVVSTVALGIAAALVILLPVPAIYLLVGDLLAFYFTSNSFGAHPDGPDDSKRVMFNPRPVGAAQQQRQWLARSIRYAHPRCVGGPGRRGYGRRQRTRSPSLPASRPQP